VAGALTCTGAIVGSTKSFDIEHEGRAGYRLRNWCLEDDSPGGGLMYRRQVTAIKSGLLDCILPDFWQWLATDVMVFVNGVGHTGSGYGAADELDGAVIHVHVTKAGKYNLLICASRNEMG
jgi:hypothetical protein